MTTSPSAGASLVQSGDIHLLCSRLCRRMLTATKAAGPVLHMVHGPGRRR